MINEDYVSFETAKLLKEKGFDGSCHRYYRYDKEDTDGNGKMFMFASDLNGFCCVTNSLLNDYGEKHEETVLAPTFQMAIKWLRKEHKLCVVSIPVVTDDDGDGGCLWNYVISRKLNPLYESGSLYESPETALNDAIKYCLQNLI